MLADPRAMRRTTRPEATRAVLTLALSLLWMVGCEARVSLGQQCAADTECLLGLICAGARCRAECRESRDCAGRGDTCVRYAGAGGVCAPPATNIPCRFHSDCGPAARCDGGECHADCVEDIDCEGLGVCTEGSCSEPLATPAEGDAGLSPGACTGGRARCPSEPASCVDLMTSSAHCGACGATCPFGETCRGGACFCDPPRSSCGSHCAMLTTDDLHCGDCATACAEGDRCADGHCCPDGSAWCGAACVRTVDDPANCGGCGVSCPSGEACRDGHCMEANDLCESAREIVLDGPRTRLEAVSHRWAHDTLSCKASPDGYFRFTLERRAIVLVRAGHSNGEPRVALLADDCSPVGIGCDRECPSIYDGNQVAVLEPGSHRVVVDLSNGGAPDDGENLWVEVIRHEIPASAEVVLVPPDQSRFEGVLAPASEPDGECGAGGARHLYAWMTCSSLDPGLTASVCDGSSELDLVVALSRGGVVEACSEPRAGCASGSVTGAGGGGLVVVTVAARDGTSGGRYVLTLDR